jgi:hypothetical protein
MKPQSHSRFFAKASPGPAQHALRVLFGKKSSGGTLVPPLLYLGRGGWVYT